MYCAYDANGNTLSDPSGKSYSWDFENRLTQALVPGTGTVAFKYDPFGRRIQKSSGLGTTNYIYEGKNLIEELDGGGTVLARYTQTTVIDEPLAMLRSGTTSYYQADALGSSTSLSTGAGGLSNTYTYDSFGKLSASTGTLTNPFQYTARELDPETGIYEYRRRYFDQSVGRFISEDPLRFRATIDFYPNALNNPMLWRDPDGRGVGWGSLYSAWNTAQEKAHQITCWAQFWYCMSTSFDNLYSISQASQGAPVYTPDELANPSQNMEGSHGANQVMRCIHGENCKKVLEDCLSGFISGGMFPH
jgi:RHS repeat-associated protein